MDPFICLFTRRHFAKVINGPRQERHNLGVNAKRQNVLAAFPPLMARHKNNGRTDKSPAICPYNTHITEVSENPHVFARKYKHKILHTFEEKININVKHTYISGNHSY